MDFMTTSLKRSVNLKNKLTTEGQIVRGKETVNFIEDDSDDRLDPEDKTSLFKLQKVTGKYQVVPVNENQPNDRLWVVIRTLKEGYVIKEHDIIKLGRMKFRVKEFRTETEYFEDLDDKQSPHPGFDEYHEVKKSTEPETNCRFCWTDEQTEENPLIGACRCDGSIKFIHFQCIKLWLEKKVTKKDGPSHCTLNWKNFE